MDRNDGLPKIDTLKLRSLSARRAWIEIVKYLGDIDWTTVALRKESVDRNANHPQTSPLYNVALRKESVDRNDSLLEEQARLVQSLSARRAWIEMSIT